MLRDDGGTADVSHAPTRRWVCAAADPPGASYNPSTRLSPLAPPKPGAIRPSLDRQPLPKSP